MKNKIKAYKKEGITEVKLAFSDIDGIMRGKYIDLDKFQSAAEHGGGFCNCVLGWDSNDQLYDNTAYTGWHTAYPDAEFKIDLSTERRMPDEYDTPLYIIDFDLPVCPRTVLKNQLKKLNTLGYGINLAFEYEFFVFMETAHSIREKNYTNLKTLTPGNFGYSVIRSSTNSDLFLQLMDYCQAMNFPLEGLHCETGPGVIEAAIKYDYGIAGADKAALFKTFSKVFFQKRQMLATFMAKWSLNYPGQSGHIHQSLYDLKTNKNIFYDKNKENNMSEIMGYYLAGMQKYLKPFLVMTAPTINSYTRLVKGAWAPTSSSWGVDNRTTALRVIPGSEKSQRIEFRLGAADGNPYLVAAANIAAGILGIEQKLKLPTPVKGSAYDDKNIPEEDMLPSNLRDSIRNFAQSREVVKMFGKEFVDHYISTREWEVREYEKNITDYQLKRYLEII